MKLTEIARFVDDVPAAQAFYEALLGAAPGYAGEGIAVFHHQGVKIFLHHRYKPGEGDLPPEDHLAFAVDDVDSACARLAARGLEIERPAADYYWGRSAYLRTPYGELIELTTEAPSP